MTLENIDPRNKLRFAFEMGLPNHVNLLVDYEQQPVENSLFTVVYVSVTRVGLLRVGHAMP